MSNAIPKILVRKISTNTEEELIISDEQVGAPGVSAMQKDTNTSKIWISWESMATVSYTHLTLPTNREV